MSQKTKLKSVWSLIKNYKWQSIFFSYLKNMLFVLLIPTIILTIGVFYFYNSSNIKALQSTNLQSILKTKGSVEKMLVDINKLNYILISDPSVAASILNTKENLNGYESLRQRQNTLNTLNSYLKSSEIIDSIYIYSIGSDFVISPEMCTETNDFYDKSWYNAYKASGKSMFIQTSYPEENGTNKALFSFVYPLSYNRSTDGLIIINIRLNTLNEYISISESETVNLITKDNKIVYSTDNSLINGEYENAIPECKKTITEIKNNRIFCFSEVENYPLILTSESEVPNSMKTKSIVFTLSCYIFLLILLLITLSFILSAKFYLDISDIIVALGLSDIPTEENDKNELSFIRTNILNNINKIETIESELYDKSNKLKNSQQIALQMQISPHFMLNTLNTVNLLLLTSENPNDKVVQINSLLSELLSNMLNTSKYIISVEEELKYTQKYIEIEKYKSCDGFDIIWDTDPECLKMKTVKFILQPIVENAIFHGIKYLKDKKGEIKISVKLSGRSVVFTISDNGKGMSRQKLEKLNKDAEELAIPQDKHLGFLNVNMRLKLAYGNECGCKIIKSDMSGTTIQIKILSEL